MTILVTGGGGYIGSHMVHALVDAGEPVVVVDNLSTGFRSALPESATLVVGDVGDQALVTSVITTHGVTEIIHFAASIVVPDSVRDPLGYYRNNTINTRALLEVAVETGVQHFIFSSTAAVYGNPQRVPVGEDAPVVPMSPYGNSKLMSEIMLKDAAAAHGLNYVILRYFNVAGADPKLRTGQADRRRHPSDQGRGRDRARAAAADRGLRHRLRHARRHLRPRLHPRQRSRARAFRCARASAARRRERDVQLRLWPRLFGARRDRAR